MIRWAETLNNPVATQPLNLLNFHIISQDSHYQTIMQVVNNIAIKLYLVSVDMGMWILVAQNTPIMTHLWLGWSRNHGGRIVVCRAVALPISLNIDLSAKC